MFRMPGREGRRRGGRLPVADLGDSGSRESRQQDSSFKPGPGACTGRHLTRLTPSEKEFDETCQWCPVFCLRCVVFCLLSVVCGLLSSVTGVLSSRLL